MASPALLEASRLVGEDLGFQRRVWRFQRLGWAGMAVFVLAGALGAFGDGPLADAASRSADGAVSVEWERIERAGRDSRLLIRTTAAPDAPLVLRLEGGLADGVTVSSVEPEPAGASRAPGRSWLRFDPPPGGGPAEIKLRLRSAAPGVVDGVLALGDSAVPLRLYVLP